MARPRHIDLELTVKAQFALKDAKTLAQFRCAQAILLPALLGSTLEQTAELLGVARATAARLQTRFRTEQGVNAVKAKRWGGRRRALMSLEEERAFLEPWMERAKCGQILVVSPLRAALAQKLGRPVVASLVYRMLARHGWRKVAPDTRHPKSDPQAQENWKKNSRKCWRIF